jgi:PAS domain S-box-containing protein
VNFFAIRWPRRIRPAQNLALVAWFAGVASPGLAQPQPGPTVLTNAAQVRGLTEAEAARKLPVRLRGVVTYFRTNLYSRFMQDDTAGIYLGRSEVEFNLQPGQAIEVEGTTSPGEFAPIVVPQAVRILGLAPFPAARPAAFEQLTSGLMDSQFVEVMGVVRAVEYETNYPHYALTLATGGGRLAVIAEALPGPRAEALVDATVRVRGICSARFNRQGQIYAIRLLAPRAEDVVIEHAAPNDPFAAPSRRLASLLRFTPQEVSGHRVKVAGTVVYQQPGAWLFIQDEKIGLKIKTRETTRVQPGDQVEVVGFAARNDFAPILEDALYRRMGGGPPPVPKSITAAEALSGTHDCRLVRLEARLLDRTRESREQFLVVEAGDLVFHAHFQEPAGAATLAALQDDSRLALTGVCVIEPGDWQAGAGWRAKAFRLLLRSPADVVVLAAPPWWTLRRVLWMTGALGVLVLTAFAWVAVLRRRVQEQTGIIRQRWQAEATLKERYLDLFENANDMVFTHDLSGRITSINRSGERLLQRGREKLLTLRLVELVTEAQREAAEHWLTQVVRGDDLPTAEWELVNAAGQRVKLEISSRLIEQAGRPTEVEGIARDVTERSRLERELLEISNREQRRIGHDLHDGVCQQLAAIAYRAEMLGDQLQELALPQAAEAEKIGALINETTAQARGVARGLFPVRLEEDGLVSALEELADSASARFHIECQLECSAPPATVDNEAARHLYYVAQEALLNAVRHGRATAVQLALDGEGEHGRLRVQDNGTGFEMAQVRRAGMGIRIMRYRARVIGATLDVTSQLGQGTTVTCRFSPRRSAAEQKLYHG